MFISSEIGSEWRTILGHPQLIECMGICVLSLAHGSELRGSNVYLLNYCEQSIWTIQPGYVPLDGLFLDFFGIIIIFLGEAVGLFIYMDYRVFQG